MVSFSENNAGNASEDRSHMVLIPSPAPGHCLPFLVLATQLASRGLKVTVLSTEYHVAEIHKSTMYKDKAPMTGLDIELVGVKDQIITGTRERFCEFFEASTEEKLVAVFADYISPLISATNISPPCCIISDMLVGWTQDLAGLFSIPHIVLHTQSAANLSLMLHVPTLIAEARLPLTATNQTQLINIPGVAPLKPSDLPSDLCPGDLLSFSYELFLRMSRRAAEASMLLVNTFRELEIDAFWALDAAAKVPKVIPIGPLLQRSVDALSPQPATGNTEDDESEKILQWLDKEPSNSVLYIAFGSAGVLSVEQIQEMAFGLETSNQSFLWVGLGPHILNVQAPTLCHSLPPDIDGAFTGVVGFMERTRDRGLLVTTWAPQLRILSHPATGAFLTHCGWNSVLEAIATGVPMLTWPQRAEQKMNARFVVDTAKVGVEFHREGNGLVERREIERVILLMLQGEGGREVRHRVEEFKQHTLKSSSSALDDFVAHMLNIPHTVD